MQAGAEILVRLMRRFTHRRPTTIPQGLHMNRSRYITEKTVSPLQQSWTFLWRWVYFVHNFSEVINRSDKIWSFIFQSQCFNLYLTQGTAWIQLLHHYNQTTNSSVVKENAKNLVLISLHLFQRHFFSLKSISLTGRRWWRLKTALLLNLPCIQSN